MALQVRWFLALAALLLSGSTALADGKMFRFGGVAEMPAIPDQQAIIAWDVATSTQTLAIETRFAPAPLATSYAWVVPLPGPEAPTIKAASPGLFLTTRAIFLPRVSDSGGGSIGLSVFVAVVLTLAVWLDARRERSWLLSLVLLVLLLTCIGGVLLPSLGKARSTASGPAPDVEILKRETIGSYDVMIVGPGAAKSNAALATWFRNNGFALPNAATPILGEYAAKSWVFAAIKLRPDVSASAASFLVPHPLIFTFRTASPVYPMRLTGLENGPLTLDLYIFGTQRAAVSGLGEVRSDECVFEKPNDPSHWRSRGGVIGIGHPTLTTIVGALPIATKLSGTLTPEMQKRDLDITWKAPRRSGASASSPAAAAWGAIELGAASIPAFILLAVVLGAILRKPGTFALGLIPLSIPIAMLAAAVAWIATPTMPIKPDGRREASLQSRWASALAYELEYDLSRHPPQTKQDVLTVARNRLRSEGVEPIEGDVPFGIAVREGAEPGSFDLISYNWCATPSVARVWPPAKK